MQLTLIISVVGDGDTLHCYQFTTSYDRNTFTEFFLIQDRTRDCRRISAVQCDDEVLFGDIQ